MTCSSLCPEDLGITIKDIFKIATTPLSRNTVIQIFGLEERALPLLFSHLNMEFGEQMTMNEIHKVMMFLTLYGKMNYKLEQNGGIKYKCPRDEVENIPELSAYEIYPALKGMLDINDAVAPFLIYACHSLVNAVGASNKGMVMTSIWRNSQPIILRPHDYGNLDILWNENKFFHKRSRMKIMKGMFYNFLDRIRILLNFECVENFKDLKMIIGGSETRRKKLHKITHLNLPSINLNSEGGRAVYSALNLRFIPTGEMQIRTHPL